MIAVRRMPEPDLCYARAQSSGTKTKKVLALDMHIAHTSQGFETATSAGS
jgi:hypothetical protein